MNADIPGTPTWIQIITGLPGRPGTPDGSFPFMAKFAIDPMNTSRLIIGTMSQVYETRTKGDPSAPGANDGWKFISPALDDFGVTALAYAPNHDNTIYVGFADGQIYRTDNDGGDTTAGNWALVATGVNAPVTALAVDPANRLLVYSAFGSGIGSGLASSTQGFNTQRVLKSNNGGANWAAFNGGLPNVPVNALQLSANGATLYAGADVGVYSTATNNAAWARYGNGLPYVQVLDLQLQTYGATTWLAAATHGRGAWIIDPPGSSEQAA
ncbi:MAG TPA: hypothetical protein VFA26_24995 [Gemmataceae bacterium]|nr:hypothetical protein [Gemmataceae bacterium]